MQKIKTKFRRLNYKIKHDLLTLNNSIIVLAIALGIAWTWGSVSSMSRNWELAQKIAEAESELALAKLEVETLTLENEYYASSEYQELTARRLQNKKSSGETMIYLEKNSEAAKNKHKENTSTVTPKVTSRSNLEQWLFFLFGI